MAELEKLLCTDSKVESLKKINAIIENGGGGLCVGQTVFSLDPLYEDTLHLLDGATLFVGGIYDSYINTYIAKLYAKHPERFCTEEEYQASITNYGVCGKYVYTEGVSVRLPKVTGFVEGTLDVKALGEIVEAGLPNITGDIVVTSNYSGVVATGAFYNTGKTATDIKTGGSGATSGQAPIIGMDGSKASEIYGNSNTVQPQSIKGYMYIVVATGSKTDIEVNLDNIAIDLNSKADTDLVNLTPQGKSLVANYAMPSEKYVDLEFGASGTIYTAPANGWFYARGGTATTANGYHDISLSVGGTTVLTAIYVSMGHLMSGNTVVYALVPVKKGQQVTLSYYTSLTREKLIRFIYAEGEQ